MFLHEATPDSPPAAVKDTTFRASTSATAPHAPATPDDSPAAAQHATNAERQLRYRAALKVKTHSEP